MCQCDARVYEYSLLSSPGLGFRAYVLPTPVCACVCERECKKVRKGERESMCECDALVCKYSLLPFPGVYVLRTGACVCVYVCVCVCVCEREKEKVHV